ncbi:hypothetical protein Pcinc_044352 [Petrolisthes cinctipes]|uniref:Uncharacterized protein n=1 Tax=Petrolisthes cinctipes TaxID=88211 RepID=A0AAE1EFD5_PETCI|nr:hypothetical protein Pcinc_044352 [Petrolisthes cinctipes]
MSALVRNGCVGWRRGRVTRHAAGVITDCLAPHDKIPHVRTLPAGHGYGFPSPLTDSSPPPGQTLTVLPAITRDTPSATGFKGL